MQVTKVQLWTSLGPGETITVEGKDIESSPAFKFVGIELGLPEPQTTVVYFAPRLFKALATTQRLRALQLPSSICSLLWETTVLP